jgi:hypothetical protein
MSDEKKVRWCVGLTLPIATLILLIVYLPFWYR